MSRVDDTRAERLRRDHRCITCAAKLAYADISSTMRNCLKCRTARAATRERDAEMIWKLYRSGKTHGQIARQLGRTLDSVSGYIRRGREALLGIAEVGYKDDGTPRCKCGLRIDKDHLVCDLYPSAAGYANDRRGAGPTYPAT